MRRVGRDPARARAEPSGDEPRRAEAVAERESTEPELTRLDPAPAAATGPVRDDPSVAPAPAADAADAASAAWAGAGAPHMLQ
jgi:hypothetical protein